MRRAAIDSSAGGGADGAGGGRSLDFKELTDLMQKPETAGEVREVMQRLLRDPVTQERFNATFTRLRPIINSDETSEGAGEDPFMRLLKDPWALVGMLENPEGGQELLDTVNKSTLFSDFQDLGAMVTEQLRIVNAEAGTRVELDGLMGSPELNGCRGVLADATPEEEELHPGRRIVILEAEASGGASPPDETRLALAPERLIFPRLRCGDAVVLDVEFGGEEEGLEGRAAVVSQLTSEELDLGFEERGGRVVVDVLPLLPGGPITERLMMYPEHLRPRSFEIGDYVELRGLSSSASLNGASATVVAATVEEQRANAADGRVVVALDQDGARLSVQPRNLLLACATAPAPIPGLG